MRLGVIGGTGLVRIEDFEFLSSQGFEVKSDDLITADTEFGQCSPTVYFFFKRQFFTRVNIPTKTSRANRDKYPTS